jgi:fatty acid desaturase
MPVDKTEKISLGPTDFDDPRSKNLLAAFDKLRDEMRSEGLFVVKPLWYAYKTLSTLAFLPLGVYLHYHGYFWLSALVMGVMWQQLGWLAHEYCHFQVFRDRGLAKLSGYFFGNILQGFSRTWWNHRHNSHHASTNILTVDPDIDNLPMLAWAESDLDNLDKMPQFLRRSIQYQSKYFLFLLPLLRIVWCKESFKFALDMKNSIYTTWRREASAEVATLTLHYIWTLGFYLTLPSISWIITWYLVSHLLSGFGIAVVVFFNHYSCEKYPQGLAANFVCLQLFTTRNMTPGIVTDWICGGLNYQIEHHLFPTMPRHNLYKCSKFVKKFCAEQGLPYMCCGFMEGLGHVLNFLQGVADIAKKRYNSHAGGAKSSKRSLRS